MSGGALPVTALEKLDLANLCDYIANLYAADKTRVGGAAFALLAQRLTMDEVRPGGPYKNEKGIPTTHVNQAVSRLFNLMNMPLPLVEQFLQTTVHKQSHAVPAKSTAYRGAYKRVAATLQRLREPVRTQALQFLARVAKADTTGEIANIARFTARALAINTPARVLINLGEANIYAWIAYMLYDHIIDGEATTALLPTANIAMRLSFSTYSSIVATDPFLQKMKVRYFNDVDVANAWELAHCRFAISGDAITIGKLPNYEHNDMLANRSCIHILGPLAVLRLSQPTSRTRFAHLKNGLRHYLIARQLSDDIHDWREDLTAGRISPVVAQLLSQTHVTTGSHNLGGLIVRLQQTFLQSGMSAAVDQILHHTALAQSALRAAGCHNNDALLKLVKRLTAMAQNSQQQRTRFLDFAHQYKSNKIVFKSSPTAD